MDRMDPYCVIVVGLIVGTFALNGNVSFYRIYTLYVSMLSLLCLTVFVTFMVLISTECRSTQSQIIMAAYLTYYFILL